MDPFGARKSSVDGGATAAETLGLRALGFVAADDELIGRFLAESGLDADALRARADEPELLGAALDFLLAQEPALVAFCAEAGVTAEEVWRARARLPGGQEPHWT